MKKKCQHCENNFIVESNHYKLSITNNNKIDLQLFCPKCSKLIEFTFIEQNDFMSLGM